MKSFRLIILDDREFVDFEGYFENEEPNIKILSPALTNLMRQYSKVGKTFSTIHIMDEEENNLLYKTGTFKVKVNSDNKIEFYK